MDSFMSKGVRLAGATGATRRAEVEDSDQSFPRTPLAIAILGSEIAKFDFLLQIPGKQNPVLLLQILLLPILAPNDSPGV
jgi:hypothetical protein